VSPDTPAPAGGADEPAARALAADNLPLALSIARRLCRTSAAVRALGRDDAEGAAFLGLMRAARGFRPQSGWTFATYAYKAITRHVLAAAKRHAAQPRPFDPAGRDVEERGPDEPDPRLAHEVADLLQNLRPCCRRVVELLFFEGASPHQVRAETGLSKERVRQIRDEAFAAMRAQAEGRPVQTGFGW
jgi:RNA polymerase sigma factor (sigma-70 family)